MRGLLRPAEALREQVLDGASVDETRKLFAAVIEVSGGVDLRSRRDLIVSLSCHVSLLRFSVFVVVAAVVFGICSWPGVLVSGR